MNRFVDIDLSRLPVPDALTPLDHDGTLTGRISDLKYRFDQAEIPWQVGGLKANPLVIVEEHATTYDLNHVAMVNDAVRGTLLASAGGADLEHKAAEFGVVRQVLVPADPDANPPTDAVMESDESLRRRRQLAVEALSTAGPEGAYKFFGLAAHPHVSDVAVFDPHSELCGDGEALLVIASNQGDAIPTDQVLDSVADFLDARIINYAVTPKRTRAIDRRQKLRPLTDKVIVEACTGLDYQVTAVLKVPYGPGVDVIRAAAEERLLAYLESRRKIGFIVSDSAIAAAVHVADSNGVALVEDADITIEVEGSHVADVIPEPKQLARVTSVVVTVEVLS
ncbi:baseplate assembly protein [Roseibium alexandrii]|uniref:Phage-related baseplate assembly protein n=1 Tax=Roseibium alexandrii (strain DSM 17067 / NCIMB 14079 / DFL-11) TaxID=244592 RepID=A0A5E8GZJ4_ROSAD|nr:baseplate J/gp47 family protein [Roseibium alexandrii]EEE45351.2 Phage-related baseplate assembly protein [Roseibium alexandrii DFL-11]